MADETSQQQAPNSSGSPKAPIPMLGQSPLRKPDESPWYCLATLYGVPEQFDYKLQARNRYVWNRIVSGKISEWDRDNLLKSGRHARGELEPYSNEQIHSLASILAGRTSSKLVINDFPRDWQSNAPYFGGLDIESVAIFDGFIFTPETIFQRCAFRSLASFKGCTFYDVTFAQCAFEGYASFERAETHGISRFEILRFGIGTSFVDAKFSGITRFREIDFAGHPPAFFGASLHPGTVFDSIKWPLPPRSGSTVDFVRSYEDLKSHMKKENRLDEELDFLLLEFQCRELDGAFHFSALIALYRILSAYGRSFMRPLLWLALTAFAGALPFGHYSGTPTFGSALRLSIANTFAILGFRKDFIPAGVVERLPDLLKVLSAFQTAFGGVLLFLLGLALRNMFRMK